MNAYEIKRAEQSEKARNEYAEYVVKNHGPDWNRAMRLIDYMITNMAFDTVVTEQDANWAFGHMGAFVQLELQRDEEQRQRDARMATQLAKRICEMEDAVAKLANACRGRYAIVTKLDALTSAWARRRAADGGT